MLLRRPLIVVVLLVASCADEPSRSTAERTTPADEESTMATPDPTYVETGDLEAIRERGQLRFLVPKYDVNEGLPRSGLPAATYRRLAEGFAARLGLAPRWVMSERLEDLIPMLNDGSGDLIVANLTVTKARTASVAFSLPLDHVVEILLTSLDDNSIAKAQDLAGRTVVVPRASAYLESLEGVAADVDATDSGLGPDGIVDLVVDGEFDATVMDSNLVAGLGRYRSDFRRAFELKGTRNIAWATRLAAPALLRELDLYITETKLDQDRTAVSREDLEGIRRRGALRVLTHNGPASYYIWKGELLGFEYELAKRFADSIGVEIEIIVPPPGEDILSWLEAGRGDLVAAAMTVTPARLERGLHFSRPYNYVEEVFVTSRERDPLGSLNDLSGRQVIANPQYSYWESLTNLRSDGPEFEFVASPLDYDTSEIISRVAAGEFDVTLADSHIAAIEATYHSGLSATLTLGDEVQHAWVMRPDTPDLEAAVNQFIAREYRGLEFNLIYNKYFKNPRRQQQHRSERLAPDKALSPFDTLVRPLAETHGFDWRVIISQMYQESNFNPGARSFAGALGLMQVLPRTAKQMNIDPNELTMPRVGIRAGVEYLAWTRDRFPDTLPVDERLWFALAGYNAGYGHVYDARRLAKQRGLDPDVWFDNVETTMLLLAERKYAQQARFGYCRGREPVAYVREIKGRYQAYLDVVRGATSAD